YCKALDELEHLFIKCLMELTQLGMMASVSYKLCDKIGKALRTCAEAIRCALENYNNVAAQLDPPRENLTWMKLMDTTTLADFDLLRDSRQDIFQQLWAQPVHCEAVNLYFGIKHAKEEIVWLNIKIQHLVTFMIDDHGAYYQAISSHMIVDPVLANRLSQQWQFCDCIHSKIAVHLHQTSQLNGFTGTL
ncbi:hypothetical protein L208DRAFT_1114386, partial [Tricholoma matsutake]